MCAASTSMASQAVMPAHVRRKKTRLDPHRRLARIACVVEDGERTQPTWTRLLGRPLAILGLVPRPIMLFTAGAVAGGVGKTITAPLERAKILLQVRGGLHQGAVAAAAQQGNLLKSLTCIARTEGILAFWKGNTAQLARIIPYSAAQLCSNEVFKGIMADNEGKLTLPKRLMCGALAGAFATVTTYPLDTIRMRMAVDPTVRSIGQTVAVLLKEGGVKSLYRGVVPTLAGIAPYMAIELATYDLVKQKLPEDQQGKPHTGFLCGNIAALCASICCYPLDTVRRRIQLQIASGTTVSSAMRGIIQEEGVQGLYRGFVANAVKNLPNKGIRLSIFDAAKAAHAAGKIAYEEECQVATKATAHNTKIA